MEDGGGGAGLGERPDSFLCLLLCRLLESPSGQGARSAHRAAGGSPGRDPPGPPPPKWDGTGWDGEMGPVLVPLGTWRYRAGSGAGAGAGPPEARASRSGLGC